jgi:hypothetical protein
MTASYPTSIKVFTSHNDVTDVIYAAHPNDIQNEVTAIETFLGTTPNISTSPSSSGSFTSTSTIYSNVAARLANIETGIVADSHTQYLRKTADSFNAITAGTGTTVALSVKANTGGQTAHIQEWVNSSGVVVSYVDANGNVNGLPASSSSAGVQDVFLLMGA